MLGVKRPMHWSEWAACAGMLLFSLAMARYCLWCAQSIALDGDGSFWRGVLIDFRALTGW